ncbi:hypothetical protein BV25DRAFT_1820712, partial [Artomyces pyxidatus]
WSTPSQSSTYNGSICLLSPSLLPQCMSRIIPRTLAAAGYIPDGSTYQSSTPRACTLISNTRTTDYRPIIVKIQRLYLVTSSDSYR